MNDRYLFRGKYIDFDEDTKTEVAKWCSGGLIFDGENPVILSGVYEMDEEYCTPEFWYTVEPETVGQCTGLHDKNGKLIFEGDIIRGYKYIAKVEWFVDSWSCRNNNGIHKFRRKEVKIIGNIHDNPELLEEQNESD